MAAKKSAQTAAKDFAADAQKTLNDQAEKIGEGFEQAKTIGQEALDAMVESSQIVVKAAESLNSDIAAYSKKSFDDTLKAATEIAQSKTVQEMIEKQTAFASAAFEGFAAQAMKFGESFSNVAQKAGAPLNAQMTAVAEKMKNLAH